MVRRLPPRAQRLGDLRAFFRHGPCRLRLQMVARQALFQDLKRFFRKRLDRRPMCIPVVIET